MRKHRCPGGVKVGHFPGLSEVSGSIPGPGGVKEQLSRHVRGLGYDSVFY